MCTPISQHFKISKEDLLKIVGDKEYMDVIPYSNAVGALMYAMVCTRLDLYHVVSVVSR